jgi:hypothetical protein
MWPTMLRFYCSNRPLANHLSRFPESARLRSSPDAHESLNRILRDNNTHTRDLSCAFPCMSDADPTLRARDQDE